MANNSLPLLDNIISNLKSLTENIVVKYSSKASEKETIAYTKAFDYYYLASNKLDSFDTYPSFSEEALRLGGVNVDSELQECLVDKKKIPESVRNRVVEVQRSIVIRDFEEQNDYYRQYVGLPNIDDKDHFYVDDETSLETGIDTTTPIHKLSATDISILSGAGFISKLIKENPDKVYLNYLGVNKLDLYRIRSANNLSIIKINKLSIPDKLFEEFMTSYEQSREYFMNAIFIKEYAALYEYYENMMGFLVMVNTIKMIMTKIFKNGIDRDFYDLVSIVKMFNAYNIPYIKDFTLEQQRIILRNINKLIRIKSTDKVLVEICSLLGMGDINIFRYYLLKTHKRDGGTGKPIFKYKQNLLGEQVLDKEKMFNLKFAKVGINETNIGLALTKTTNYLEYDEVTESDPFWWEDDQLKSMIYDNEFNFIETKYLSFQMMYKMSNLIFEQIYFLSLLHDRKNETSSIKLLFPKIDPSTEISLFDACILLFALTCKRNNMKGNIIYEPTKVGSVLGFNFKLDLKPIVDDIRNDPTIYDEELIKYISSMSVNNVQDINTLYGKIKGFRDYIEQKMFYATDKDVYQKYRTIYKTFMTTDTMGELFKLPDGDIAESYKEYLMYSNYDLYQLIDTLSNDGITEIINHIISKLEEYCDNLKYLHLSGVNLNSSINAVWELINFFKSYTVDIHQFNIIYLIDGRIENLIKLIDYATFKITNHLEENPENGLLYDTVQYGGNINLDHDIKLTCRSQHHSYIGLDDKLVMKTLGDDSIKLISVKTVVWDELIQFDSIKHTDVVIEHNDALPIEDIYSYLVNLYGREDIELRDKIGISNELRPETNINLTEHAIGVVRIYETDKSGLVDNAHYCGTIYSKDDKVNLEDWVYAKLNLYLTDCQVKLYDTLSLESELCGTSKFNLRDKIRIVYN